VFVIALVIRGTNGDDSSSSDSVLSSCDFSLQNTFRESQSIYIESIIKDLNQIKTFSEVQRAQEILRILHLYILPALVLKTRDVTLLQDALEMVEGQIATTSKNILGSRACRIL
jgi:hypothetical protein